LATHVIAIYVVRYVSGGLICPFLK